jgi:uncharacterized protein (UPF0335 family)
MSAESEIEEQRKNAVLHAMPIWKSLQAEKKGLSAREKAMYAALARVNVDVKCFREAIKRAKQTEQNLQLFDSEAMELETWIRGWVKGEKPAESEADSEPEYTEEEKADMAAASAEPSPSLRQEKREAVKRRHAERLETALDPDEAAALAGGEGEDLAEVEEEGQADQTVIEDTLDAPPPDDDYKGRTRHVHPAAGAEGVSMADIPMPGDSQIHDLAAEQKKRAKSGFKDHRERMPAAQYREEMNKASQT